MTVEMEEGGGSQYVTGLGSAASYIMKESGLSRAGQLGKDSCVQLVLETSGTDKINILEYLKTEMLDDKRRDKD